MRDSIPMKPFELVWLDAAMSFSDPKERESALKDVADMTGRSFHAVRIRAINRYADKLDAMAVLRDRARRGGSRYGHIHLQPACVGSSKAMGAR